MEQPSEPGGRSPSEPDADPEVGIAADYDAEVLAALDAWEPSAEGPPTVPARLVSWRRTSMVGAVMTGMAFGLRDVLEPQRREQVVIEVDADREADDGPIALGLDLEDPSRSWCVVRRTS